MQDATDVCLFMRQSHHEFLSVQQKQNVFNTSRLYVVKTNLFWAEHAEDSSLSFLFTVCANEERLPQHASTVVVTFILLIEVVCITPIIYKAYFLQGA